jgi:hypothetical protein
LQTLDDPYAGQGVSLSPLRLWALRKLSVQGQKRKCRRFQVVSALPHKADIAGR